MINGRIFHRRVNAGLAADGSFALRIHDSIVVLAVGANRVAGAGRRSRRRDWAAKVDPPSTRKLVAILNVIGLAT